MEDDQESDLRATRAAQQPPPLVSLTPFSPAVSPSPRRLSSHFNPPNRPVRAARQLAWVSLQGRIVGAEEASSARTIGGGLSPEETVAWELFSPIHRILTVAVVAVAASNSEKNKQIFKLEKSVELRDQVLSSMQQKLDSLCEQVNSIKDQPETWVDTSNAEDIFNELYKRPVFGCGCEDNLTIETSRGDEMLKYKMPPSNVAEQEERRMSDLSDWASSVTSSVDIQLSSLAIEQDVYNLKKECEEKDVTIKELYALLQTSEVANSKRIAELEDMIRVKNMRITKLKKDMSILEQKVVSLARLQRPSSATGTNTRQLPVMADNLVYDMDSTTSPSSSDSDCPPRDLPQTSVVKRQNTPVQSSDFFSKVEEGSEEAKCSISLVKPIIEQQNSWPTSPLKEKSMNQKTDAPSSLRPKQSLLATGDLKNRRRAQVGSKALAPQKRWV